MDTNVWSRVAEADAGKDLRSAAHKANVDIIAAPSVLYELARIPVLESRQRALRLVTEAHWKRLMPEAYLEAQEIIAAIGKHHPEWLVDVPDTREHQRTFYDWARRNTPAKRRLRSNNKAGVWERFRHAPDLAFAHLGALEGNTLNLARDEAHAARQEMIEQKATTAGSLSGVKAVYQVSRPGWRGDAFAPWRGEALESLSHYLLDRAEGPYLDWISPFVALRRIHQNPSAWASFWLYEIAATETPRQWIRWAFRYLARFRNVSTGTPCDIQLATYLMDADCIASADKLLIEFVEEAKKYAPVPLAKGIRVVSKPNPIRSLLDEIALLGG